jgi:osmotically-inducible protein OsmY
MARISRKSDTSIHRDVLAELSWDTRVDATDVGVEVDQGIVTLTGIVDSQAKRLAAQEAAHRVAGVRAVVNDVEVHLPTDNRRTDAEIAAAAHLALAEELLAPVNRIQTTVSHGVVLLQGEVDYWAQRVAAEEAVQRLAGVLRVTNEIRVRPHEVAPHEIQRAIDSALARLAATESHGISIGVEKGEVTLSGRVRSWAEKRAILAEVSHAPGVQSVRDEIGIDYS